MLNLIGLQYFLVYELRIADRAAGLAEFGRLLDEGRLSHTIARRTSSSSAARSSAMSFSTSNKQITKPAAPGCGDAVSSVHRSREIERVRGSVCVFADGRRIIGRAVKAHL